MRLFILIVACTFLLGASLSLAQVEGDIANQPVIPGQTSASPAAQADINRINAGAKGAFVPLVGIPFVEDSEVRTAGLAAYVNSLYTAVIVIAAVLAVLRIVIAGVQYMLSDIVTTKAQAKKNIRNSLLGLILVVAAVLVLETINPQLTNLSVLNLLGLSGDLRDTPIRVDTGGSPPTYTGPSSCGRDERLIQNITNNQIVRECISISEDTNSNIPNEGDLGVGEVLEQQDVDIPCGNPNGCNAANGYDNLNGVSSASATCDELSSGTGQFNQLSVTQGICTWVTQE